MQKLKVALALGSLAAASVIGLQASQAAPAANDTCTGGAISAGSYRVLRVTGTCDIPSGVVNAAQVLVAPGGFLDAASDGQPAAEPADDTDGDAGQQADGDFDEVIAPGGDLHVTGNIAVGGGAGLILGCTPSEGCSGSNDVSVGGNINADNAEFVIVHGATIGGNIVLNGGGGGVTCGPDSLMGTAPAFGGPAFMNVEESTIGRNLVVSGVQSCWFGTFRDTVGGNEIVTGNQFADPDATEVASNTINGNLVCSGNDPAAQVGDSEGANNEVQGHALGECASLAGGPGNTQG